MKKYSHITILLIISKPQMISNHFKQKIFINVQKLEFLFVKNY